MAGRYDGLERVRWGGQDGSCYAIARSSVCQLYEATSDKPVATFAHGQPVTDCDFTSCGLVVTGCSDCHVRVWDRRQVEARSMPETSPQFGSYIFCRLLRRFSSCRQCPRASSASPSAAAPLFLPGAMARFESLNSPPLSTGGNQPHHRSHGLQLKRRRVLALQAARLRRCNDCAAGTGVQDGSALGR